MKPSHLLAAACTLLSLGARAQVADSATPLPPEASAPPAADDAEARQKALLWKHGGTPSADYLAFKQKLSFDAAATAGPTGIKTSPSATPTWRPLGPIRMNAGAYSGSPNLDTVTGRLTAIVTHPTAPATLYVAVEGGGVWKSTNADPASSGDWTWTCLTDSLPSSSGAGNISVGDLAMEPSDSQTLYMGMGAPGRTEAVGFFYSTDGGTTWTQGAGLGTSTATLRIAALGNRTLVVATTERAGGLYRSTDGGRTFTAIQVRPGDRTYNLLSMAALSAQNLVASGTTYDYTAGAWKPFFARSGDGGQTWQPAGSFPTTFTVSGETTPHRLDAWSQQIVAGPGGVGYALVGDMDRALPDGTRPGGLLAKGLFVTTDGGVTWTFRDAPTLWSFPGTDGVTTAMMLTVDPTDAGRLFAGSNAGNYRSLDGGRTWAQMTAWNAQSRVYAHADSHVAAWSRTGARLLYVGNDGGLAVFRDPYRATVPSGPMGYSLASDPTFVDHRRNKGIQSHMLYTIACSEAAAPADAPWRVAFGAQDNGTGLRADVGGGMDASTTYALYPSGDGQGVIIHPTDASRILAAGDSDRVYALSGVASDGTWASAPRVLVGAQDAFFTPLVPVPTDPQGNTVLTADLERIYVSADFGGTWSPLATSGLPQGFQIRRLAVYASNPQYMAVTGSSGTATMLGCFTEPGANGWRPFGAFPTNGSAQPANIWGVSISARDPHVLYATSVGFDRNASHIWRSADGGATWRALDGSPSAPNGYPFGILAQFLVESKVDPATLFAGTDFGVYVSRDTGATWTRLGAGLPLVQATDLWEASDGSKLRVATYGRGVWEIGRVEVSVSPAARAVTVGHSAAFAATVKNSANGTVTWSVLEAGGGSVTGAGLYTAPGTPGTYHVRATSAADPNRYADATVTVVPAPSITGFTASPATVREGAASSLTATFANGTGAVTGLGALASGQSLSTGVLRDTRTFTLVVTNAAGDQATATTTVSVIKLPVITSFTAAQPLATAGFSTTLTPVFQYGTAAISEIGPVSSGVAYGTGILTQDKTWTLTVTNSLGDRATATCTVRAVAPPVITTFTASPQIVRAGGQSALSVAFTGGTGVINGPIGPVGNGTYYTPPLYYSTTYVLTVTNAAGTSVSAAVTVSVAMGTGPTGGPEPTPAVE